MKSGFEVHALRIVQRFIDLIAVVLAFITAFYIRFYTGLVQEAAVLNLGQADIYLISVLFTLLTFGMLQRARDISAPYKVSFEHSSYRIFIACYQAMIWMIALTFFFKFLTVSRLLVFSATNLAFLYVVIFDKVARLCLRHRRRHSAARKRFAFVCFGQRDQQEMLRQLNSAQHNEERFELAFWVWARPEMRKENDGSSGSLDQWIQILERHAVDGVVFPERIGSDEDVAKGAMLACEERGIEVWIRLPFGETSIRSLGVEHLEGVSYLSVRIGPKSYTDLFIKSVFDRVAAALILLISSPLLLVIALLVKTSSSGPVIFKQHRAGLYGRCIVFYKFRSMVVNADQLKADLRSKNEMSGPVFKVTNDPRITPLGRFLRKTSLDELPQLWNVLKGEMSLVGPRPLIIPEAEKVTGWARRRLSMKPGITGLWQVSGRNQITDFNQWAKLDLKYIDEWSLWLDFKILIQTIPAVLRGTGV